MTRKPYDYMPKMRLGKAGFTLLELLTALVVIGIAASIFFRLFTSSMSLAASSTSHEVAANLAREFLTEIQASPERFVWPDYDDVAVGEPQAIQPVENGPIGKKLTGAPTVMPTVRRAFNRDRSLYNDFVWEASAILPAKNAQYVEVTVEILWQDRDLRVRRFWLSSAVPRSQAEGTGL